MRLEQDGLVSRSDRGIVVRTRSPEEILDIYEVRIVLEARAASTAALRHVAFDEIRLEQRCRAAEEADPNDEKLLAQVNREFHRAVWIASHNESLVDLLNRLNLHLVRYPATTLAFEDRWERALRQHRALVESIIRRDAEKAAQIAQDHFEEARNIRLALWEAGFEP